MIWTAGFRRLGRVFIAVGSVMLFCLASPRLARAQSRHELYDPQRGFVELAVPEPNTPAADLAAARRMLAEGRPKRALKRLKRFLKLYPESPLRPEALFVMGDCQMRRGNYFKAYKFYEQIIDGYAGSAFYVKALSRELEIAKLYLSGTRRKFLGLRIVNASGDALEMLSRIQERFPGSDLAAEALLTMADYHYRRGEFEDAAPLYKMLAERFPDSEYYRRSLLRNAQATHAGYRGPHYDASILSAARARYEQFLRLFPDQAAREGIAQRIERIDWQRAQKDYMVGCYYLRAGHRSAAAFYFRQVVDRYGKTDWADKARKQLEKLGTSVNNVRDEARPKTAAAAAGPNKAQ